MRTLNEQIQRLRDVLVTCYNAVKRKGGTIPEVGKRNMYNLPAAVRSIPQSHTKLVDLEVTANGVYLPDEHDADGFSKVTARFDISSLPKVKVGSFAVSDDCINEEGRWEAEDLIDTSKCVHFQSSFQNNQKIVSLNASNWNTSNVSTVRWMFAGCRNLEEINVTGWDMRKVSSNATGFQSMFDSTSKLKKIIGINSWKANIEPATYSNFIRESGIEELDLSGYKGVVIDANAMFYQCYSLHTLNISDLDVSKCSNFSYCFSLDTKLKELDLTKWDMSSASSVNNMFWRSNSLTSIIGGKNIDDVLANNIGALNGLKITLALNDTIIDAASILALVNGLADLTGQNAQTLTLGSTIGTRLDTEQIAGMPAKEYLASKAGEKNWTISF